MGSSTQQQEVKNPQIFLNYINYNNNGSFSQSSDLTNNSSHNNEINEGEAAAPAKISDEMNSYNNNGVHTNDFEFEFKNGDVKTRVKICKDGKIYLENNDVKNININGNNLDNLQSNNIIKNNTKTNTTKTNENSNKDNNLGNGNICNKPETNNKEDEKNKDNNVGIYKKKEIKKDSETNKEYNPIFGKGGQENSEEEKNKQKETNKGNPDINVGGNNKYVYNDQGKLTIKEKEDNKNTGTFGNPELDKIKEKNDFDKGKITNYDNYYYDEDDLEMSQNILMVSLGNLNLQDQNDIQVFVKDVQKKMHEGYFPLYLQIDNDKPSFFYVKQDSNIKPALNLYLRKKGITSKGENYTLYNNGKKIDNNALIGDLNLQLFAKITNNP